MNRKQIMEEIKYLENVNRIVHKNVGVQWISAFQTQINRINNKINELRNLVKPVKAKKGKRK
jgi:hypothetical protein